MPLFKLQVSWQSQILKGKESGASPWGRIFHRVGARVEKTHFLNPEIIYCSVFYMLFVLFFFSIRPNIFLGIAEGSAQYKKWYFELIIDQVEPFLTAEPTHLRVGWASASGYAPYPGGGEGWGGNGVGDDLYSYGFDGLHLWSGKNWFKM